MKLLIVGSRNIIDFDLSPYIPTDVDTVICGDTGEIERLAEQYADLHRLSKYILRPQYARYRRAAPLKRNEQMVALADAVLVIWDGCSKETQHVLKYAEKTGKPTTLIFASTASQKFSSLPLLSDKKLLQ